MKRLALLFCLIIFSSSSFALIKCQPGDMACLYKANEERDALYLKKTGEKFSAPLYGDTGNKHLEYDIVHKDGTKEHCYQVMEGHSVTCH